MSQKDEKLKETLRELAAAFFSRESNRQSLITVTKVEIWNRGGAAKIYITVLPEDKEQDALEFAHRQLTRFKEYVIEHSRIGRIPFFEVAIDHGERNRQRIDEITGNL